MELFRSEEMQLMQVDHRLWFGLLHALLLRRVLTCAALDAVQLMMPAESAHDTVAVLGEVGLLQFKDLNSDKSAFQRTFANQVRIVGRSMFISIPSLVPKHHILFVHNESASCGQRP